MVKKLSVKQILVIFIVALINVFLVLISTIRTNYTITAKGGLVEASDIIKVSDSKDSSNYYTVYVISFNHSTIFQNFLAQHIPSTTLGEITASYSYFTSKENQLMGEIEHNSSVMQTLICAYDYAKNYDSSIKLDYQLESLVVNYYYLGSQFKIGDEIIAIDGVNVDDCDLNLAIGEGWLKPEIGTKITYLREGQTYTININSETDYVYCYPYYDIDYNSLSPKVTINRGYTNGPSGGLLRTLALIDDLLEIDLSQGRKIAGTGTIAANGYVGAIGGIKQKIYTALSHNVDIFFCPSANYEEALETYNLFKDKTKMQLIEVDNLTAALEVLTNEK